MSGLASCTTCGLAAFPRPLRCARCGGGAWRDEPLGSGTVEETTVVRRAPGGLPAPVRLGSVRLDAGPVVVARLAPAAGAGDRVSVELDGGVPVASPRPRRRG